MRVAGFGFRAGTTPAALAEALQRAGGRAGLQALATAEDKVDHPAFQSFVQALALPLIAIPVSLIAAAPADLSPHAPSRYGGRGLAEAAALAAAGAGATLVARRATSTDKTATAAIAATGAIDEGAMP